MDERTMGARRAEGLFSPAFSALLAAKLFSLTGEAITRFALPLHLLNLTGSATLYGAVAAAAFVPYILLAPVGGVLADRLRKQRLMAALDLGLALVAAAYLALSGAIDITVVTLATLMLLYAGQAIYQPAVQASVPALVAGERVTQGIALVSQVGTLTGILGPVLGGAMLGVFGIASILEVSVAGFVISCALIALLARIPFQPHARAGRPVAAAPLGRLGATASERRRRALARSSSRTCAALPDFWARGRSCGAPSRSPAC